MTDLTQKIAGIAQQAAREGAPSLLHHATRSQTGEATLTVKIALKVDGHAHQFDATWKATHTDSDGDALPPEIVDDRQAEMGIKA